MARRSSGNRILSLVVLVVFGAISLWMRGREDAGGSGVSEGGGGGFSGEAGVGGGATGRGGFTRLDGCRLVSDRSNDGDSFRLDWDGRGIVLRLYFVDAPEKYHHPRGFNVERLADQGRYFGELSEERTIEVGLAAREFTLNALKTGAFHVLTRWESVYKSERDYGLVVFDDGPDAGRYLSELLVAEGLARIHTKGVDLPDGRARRQFENHLREIEKDARKAKRGGWGGG